MSGLISGYGTSVCRPAARILGTRVASCDKCPFPFCAVAEAGVLKSELRGRLAKTMRMLGNTIEETARALDISLRSVNRYASAPENMSCAQCNLIHSQDVMCKSNIYTVVHKDGEYATVLNRHGHATEQELKIVEYFIEYVFPSSTVERSINVHDHWVLSKVEPAEAEKFEGMCNALSQYTLSLGGGIN
ncbi:hypothetical protein MUP59_05735 [Candidatus Bathyarchaeota archaeon]|nr:hypothetical protein [Candidatus Bathyarchaeota archaeon]